MEFTVKRSEWRRGQGNSFLYEDGKRCCLGFYANSCGLSDEQIDLKRTPASLKRTPASLLLKVGEAASQDGPNKLDVLLEQDAAVYYNTETCNRLMMINDQYPLSENVREEKLALIFESIGVKVNFVD